jgi:hypothetical protein
LGAYVRDEVVSLHQDLAVRPKKEDQHQRLVEVLRVLGDRLKCVHQDLRRDYESRRPLSDISAAEIYGITQRCRLALARVDESMGSATSKRPPPYHPARPTGDEVAATVPTDEPAAQLVKAPVAPSSASPAKPPLDASPPLPRDVVIPVDRDRVP